MDDEENDKKRIKQLENQNIKFKCLLKNALDLSNQEASSISKLKDEAESLKLTIQILETEKSRLENELNSVLEDNNESDMMKTFRKLEAEHRDMRMKLNEVIKEINRENSEIEDLRAEDKQLRQTMDALENEKLRLLNEIKKVEDTEGCQSSQSLLLQKKLAEVENERARLVQNVPSQQSSSDVISNFKFLEQTYRDYVEAMQEHASIQKKVSELEGRNEELIKVLQKTDSEDTKLKIKLNESIISANSYLLEKISEVKSKLESNFEINTDVVKTMDTSEQLESRISELENERNILYGDLEKTLENSTYEIGKLSENILDPEIRRIVNEIEIQKAMLLCNLKTLKLKGESLHASTRNMHISKDITDVPVDINQTKEVCPVPATSGLHNLEDSGILRDTFDNIKIESTAAKEEHQKLEEEISRLEQEREMLLLHLQSITSMRSNTHNEQLQTPSELHGTFMQEESSYEVVIAPNFDDATNQLYADEEARLEQRIRELENENFRIKKELDSILTEIKNDKSEMSQLQCTGQMLRERIEELEHKNLTLDK